MSKKKLSSLEICGKVIHIGDYLEVQYTTGERFKGGIIKGTVIDLWDEKFLQGQLSNGWCFHDDDRILKHKPQKEKEE